VSCRAYRTRVDPQSCSFVTYELTAGGGCEGGRSELGHVRVVFSGRRYQGETVFDPGDAGNVVTFVGLVITVAGLLL